MAFVKAKFITNPGVREKAKAYVRYISHRPGRDGERINREIFTKDGTLSRLEAYEAIDKAKRGTVFYRIVLRPDPGKEDKYKDLDLRELTEQTMMQLQDHMQGKNIQFLASIHADHTNIRHVHVLALVQGRLKRAELKVLRQGLTDAARAQRQDRDLILGHAVRQVQHRRGTPMSLKKDGEDARQGDPPVRELRPFTPKKEPACPNCGPDFWMENRGSNYECIFCGLSFKRASSQAPEFGTSGQGAGLEISLGKEVGEQ